MSLGWNADAGIGDGDHRVVSPAARAAIVTRPPSGVNLTALARRLISICLSARLSASISSLAGTFAHDLDLALRRARRDDPQRFLDHAGRC